VMRTAGPTQTDAPGIEAELCDITRMTRPLRSEADLDPLLERIGDARFVLIGEASHGTAEYYRWRAALTRRLIAEHGFDFVAVEGDWPDCFRVNMWLKGHLEPGQSAADVLRGFERWPTWMWANTEVAEFLNWLRDFNQRVSRSRAPVGFYGLDVYSLWDSMRVVTEYLAAHRPDALEAAVAAVRCFEPYAEDPQRYAWATRLVPASCEDDVIRLLVEVGRRTGPVDHEPEAELDLRQNAEVLAGAERYYRTMVRGDAESWNVRDCHMADTLDRLAAHHGPASRGVVWEHNTHVGDARATDVAGAGMVNLGQVVRDRHARDGVALIGCCGHRGTVIAADSWGSPMRVLPVPEAPPGTHEALLHDALGEPAVLVFPPHHTTTWLRRRRGHRAIGVVYDPRAERYGNWVPTVMGRRYDALLSFDDTHALHPLHAEAPQPRAEQETYPSGR
jgi:erythromycin esterase